MARQYAKRSENITRNNMIVTMWHNTNKSLKQIADTFNVSYGTVLNAIHKHVEYNQGTYGILLYVNENTESCGYTQAVVTRAWLCLKRWYPAAANSYQELKNLTLGAEIDNNIVLSPAVENLLINTIDYVNANYNDL